MSCGIVGGCSGGMDSCLRRNDEEGTGCSVVGFGFASCSVCFGGGRRRKVRDSHAGSRWHLRRCLKHRRLSCLSPTHALGDLPVSRASLRGDIRFPHQRSTAVRDGIRLEVVMEEGSPPMMTTVEPHRGSEALIPVTPGRTISPASQCGRHRRPKKGNTDSAGAPGRGCAA